MKLTSARHVRDSSENSSSSRGRASKDLIIALEKPLSVFVVRRIWHRKHVLRWIRWFMRHFAILKWKPLSFVTRNPELGSWLTSCNTSSTPSSLFLFRSLKTCNCSRKGDKDYWSIFIFIINHIFSNKILWIWCEFFFFFLNCIFKFYVFMWFWPTLFFSNLNFMVCFFNLKKIFNIKILRIK